MLSSARQNTHRSRLPALGAIVSISTELTRKRYYPAKRWIVESFPLCDSADWRYSRGIHTVNIVSVCGRFRARLSGFWLDELPN